MKIEIPTKVNIHNKFEFELKDSRTGKVKQKAYAYNIVLNQGLKILSNFSWTETDDDGWTYYFRKMVSQYNSGATITPSTNLSPALMNSIHIGTGTGTLSISRTELFNHLAAKKPSNYDRTYDWSTLTASYTGVVSWNESEIQNSAITEVGCGINYGQASNYLNTHALIEDAVGNPVTINKGEFDILTVYATIYITLDQPANSNVQFVEGDDAVAGNFLLDLAYRNVAVGNIKMSTGKNGDAISGSDNHVKAELNKYNIGLSKVVDDVNMKMSFSHRIPNTSSNSLLGLREIGFGVEEHSNGTQFDGAENSMRPIFRAIFPITGVYEGYDIVGESLGSGDGSKVYFPTRWRDINSLTVYKDGVEQVLDTDYTIEDDTDFATNILNSGTVFDTTGYGIDELYDGDTEGSVCRIDTGEYLTISDGTTEFWSSRLRIFMKDQYYPISFILEGSNDNSNWTEVITGAAGASRGWHEFDFNPQKWKYWRITGTDETGNTGRAYEMELINVVPNIKFTSAPAIDEAITADYSIDYIPKDENHVLDISFSIQFADGNAS